MSQSTNATPQPQPGDDNSVWAEGFCSPACIGQPVMFGKLASVELDHQYCLKSGYKEYPHIHEGPYKAKSIWDSATPEALSGEKIEYYRTEAKACKGGLDCRGWSCIPIVDFLATIDALKPQPALNKMPRCIHDGSKMEIMCRGCGDSFDGYSDKDKQLALTRGPQPAPVSLAEDEALVRIGRRAVDRIDDGAIGDDVIALLERLSLRSRQLAQAKKWIAAIFRESGPGSHPGRTPEEAADELLNGGTNG